MRSPYRLDVSDVLGSSGGDLGCPETFLCIFQPILYLPKGDTPSKGTDYFCKILSSSLVGSWRTCFLVVGLGCKCHTSYSIYTSSKWDLLLSLNMETIKPRNYFRWRLCVKQVGQCKIGIHGKAILGHRL